jgi:hypothetical protein
MFDFEKEFKEKLAKGEFLYLKDVKSYIGKFTGKMVKPDNEYKNQDLKKIKKCDQVIVFNLEDFNKL